MRSFISSILVMTILSFYSFSPIDFLGSKDCNQTLEGFVNDNWTYDTVHNIVLLEGRKSYDFFFENLPESECMKGKSKIDVEQLFGKPHKIQNNKYMYYLGAVCNLPSARDCTYIHFDFDDKGMYKTMGVSGWSKSH